MICKSNETLVSLERLGIENIGQVLKLPKKGLRHRFGKNLIERIDQITSNNEITLKKIITPIVIEKRKDFLYSILDKKILLQKDKIYEGFKLLPFFFKIFLKILACRSGLNKLFDFFSLPIFSAIFDLFFSKSKI